jgi:hypothetical protein
MRPSIFPLLCATIAVGGVGLVASATNAGTAPGSGEKTFDAPGCQPNEYDGPGRIPRYPVNRDCPRPTAVILAYPSYRAGTWQVKWDGSRSFAPVGGRLAKYQWITGSGPRSIGKVISVSYTHPGVHDVVLYVTEEGGLTGEAKSTVRLR